MSAHEDAVWDTTLASRIQPRTDAERFVEIRAAQGVPVIVASVALAEVATGYRRAADRGDARYHTQLAWLEALVAGGPVSVAGLDGLAAILYGQLRARRPTPASARRSTGHRSRTEHRAAWLHDLQIAATAWAAGLPVVTENVADFKLAAKLIERLHPDRPPLTVLPGKELELP